MHRLRYFSLLVCLLAVCISARAQAGSAAISGRVVDHSGAVIQKADVSIKNIDTGTTIQSHTNDVGIYTFPSIKPGNYVMRVEKQGFRSVDVTGLTLYTQDQLARNFSLEVGSSSESITVTGGTTNDSPAVSMTVSREFVENMPLNGRSFQDLIQLAPGAVSSQSGYYSINGQRTDGNNYTVDGVSSNLGGYNNISGGTSNGGALAGVSPSQTALGTTQTLASIDSLQEFTIQTSGYTAEYGRNPGGQVAFTTRSGTNDLHGTLFDYFRNTVFDANSFQNNYNDSPRTAEHQNDFGGTVGGPLIFPKLYNGKGKSFYFFSYEGLRLLLPASEEEYVPTQAFRSWASPSIQPYLNASPLPNPGSLGNQDGCTIADPTTGKSTACDALFYYGYSYPEKLDNISVRVDQNFGTRFHGFVRYADTPSSKILGAELVNTQAINSHTWTAGLTTAVTSTLLDEFRFNYSRDGEGTVTTAKSVGGSIPIPRNLLILPAYDSAYSAGFSTISVPGTSLNVGPEYTGSGTTQGQYQLTDSLTWLSGRHALKFGGDWRRIQSTFESEPYFSQIQSTSLSAIQNGYATSVHVGAIAPGKPVFDNLSLYAQDHWRITPTLTVDYGLRWEFNPPPGPSNGHYPAVLTSNNLIVATLAPLGTPPYKTGYDHFAPRFGFSWTAIPSQRHPLTLRAGVGIFYDTGQAVVGQAYAGSYPFMASGPILTNVAYPLSDAALTPPSPNIPITSPYPNLTGISSPNLTLPYTEQWSLSLDESISTKNVFTVSYVGNNGRKLLFTQTYQSVPGNPAFASGIQVTSNASQSSYNSIQVQDRGRIAKGLDLVGSFTYAHSLDNASNDFSTYAPIWGNSAYDIRRMLNLALNYETPTIRTSNLWVKSLAQGWLLSNRFATQSGYPVTITQATVYLPNGTAAQYSPDLVPNVPIYLHGAAADLNGKPSPGNWRLNRAAFACTTTGATSGACTGTPTRQGTLGRNYIRNPAFWVLNTSLQRSIPIYGDLHLNIRAEAFNIFNHPSPDLPLRNTLSTSNFGQLIGLNTIGSSNALYAMGAARSLQFSVRLQF